MPIFIKAGLWAEKIKGLKGELNLTQLFLGGGNNSYSLTEALTGGTWVDGKPIYRKVFNFTVPASTDPSTQVQINHNLNIETYLKADITGVVDDGSSFRTFIFPLSSISGNPSVAILNGGYTVTTDNSVILEDVKSDSSQTNFSLILEYTKI